MVILLVWDGLRPDFVRPDLTPVLCEWARRGVQFGRHRSVFPSETRVNSSSIATGCYPERHGIVANRFYSRDFDALIDTGNHEDLERLRGSAGSILGAPTVAARLRVAGRKVVVVGAGSPGSTLLQDPDGPSWLVNTRGVVYPPTLAAAVGVLPGSEASADDWNDKACSIFHSEIAQKHVDFGVLWLCDPDFTQHHAGLGAGPSLDAIRRNDARFAELIRVLPRDATLFVASDHGFSTVSGDPIEGTWITDSVTGGATPVPNGALFDVSTDAAAAAETLLPDRRIGALLARHAVGGTFGFDEVRLFHASRSPDLYFSSAWDREVNEHGIDGRVFGPRSLATHGSLSPFDLHSVLIAVSGSARGPDNAKAERRR